MHEILSIKCGKYILDLIRLVSEVGLAAQLFVRCVGLVLMENLLVPVKQENLGKHSFNLKTLLSSKNEIMGRGEGYLFWKNVDFEPFGAIYAIVMIWN